MGVGLERDGGWGWSSWECGVWWVNRLVRIGVVRYFFITVPTVE
jgi:hypothetical protein